MRFGRGVFGEKGHLQYSGCSGGQSAWAQQGRVRTRKCPYTYSTSALSLVEVNIEKRRVAVGWFLVAGFWVEVSLSFSVKMSVWKISYGLCLLGYWSNTWPSFSYLLVCALSMTSALRKLSPMAYKIGEPSCHGERVPRMQIHITQSYQEDSNIFHVFLTGMTKGPEFWTVRYILGMGWCLPSWGRCWHIHVSHGGGQWRAPEQIDFSCPQGPGLVWQSLRGVSFKWLFDRQLTHLSV